MYNCVVIFGESNSGKSYATNMIKKKINVKTFHFDFVISLACESIRNFFEKKKFENEAIVWYRRGLDVSNNELDNFLSDLNKMISINNDFFKDIYIKSIKGTRPSWSFRPGIDKPKDVINLGSFGQLLNPFGSHIMDLVFIYLIKGTFNFVIEGIYFSNESNFLKKLQTKCKKISYLQTIYNQETKCYTYEFNKKKINSLLEIIKKIKNELNLNYSKQF